MKQKQLIFVSLEVIIGTAFAIIAMYIFISFDKKDLFDSILYGFMIGFVAMILGIGLVGYFHCKYAGKLNEFGKAMAWCCLGILAAAVFDIVIGPFLFRNIHPFFSILIPGAMAVTGFNYGMFRKGKRNDNPKS
jgi:hypothetical protein